MKQFSWKTNWKLAEELHNQRHNKDLQVTGQDWKKGIGSWPVPLGGICKEEVYMGGPLPWGASRLSHSLGITVLESCLEEASLPASWEICWDRKKGWRSWTLRVKSAYMLACQQSGQRQPCTGVATSPHFPIWRGKPQPHSFYTTAWSDFWAETQSSCAETDQGIWGLIQVEPWRALSACIQISATRGWVAKLWVLGGEALGEDSSGSPETGWRAWGKNADHCNKELETIKMTQSEIEN